MTDRDLRDHRAPSLTTHDIDSDPDLLRNRRAPSITTHDIDSDPDLAAIRESDNAIKSGGIARPTSTSTSAGPKTFKSFRGPSGPQLNRDCSIQDTPFDAYSDNEAAAADQEKADEIAAGAESDDEPGDDDEDNTNSNALFSSAQARADEMATTLRQRRLKSDAKKAHMGGRETSSAEPPSRRSSTNPPQPLAGETNNDILAGTMTLPIPVAIGLIMFAPFAMMLLVMWWHSTQKKQNPEQVGSWGPGK